MKVCYLNGIINEKEILDLEAKGKIRIDNESDLIIIIDDSAIDTLEKYYYCNDFESDDFEIYSDKDIIEFIIDNYYDHELTLTVSAYNNISIRVDDVRVIKWMSEHENEIGHINNDNIRKFMLKGLRTVLKGILNRMLNEVDYLDIK